MIHSCAVYFYRAGVIGPGGGAAAHPPGGGATDYLPLKLWYLGQTKGGRWNGKYTVTWPDGTKCTRDIYAATKDECEKLLAAMIVEMKTEVAAKKERLRGGGKAG